MTPQEEYDQRQQLEVEAMLLTAAALLVIDKSVVKNTVATSEALDKAADNLRAARGLGFNWAKENAVNTVAANAVGVANDADQWATDNAAYMAEYAQKIATMLAEDYQAEELQAATRNKLAAVRQPRAETYAIAAINGGIELAKFAMITALTMQLTAVKTWHNMRDSRVRKTHQLAGGQTVPAFSTFTVGGYALRYPHDPLAPIQETANCRCVVEYDTPIFKKVKP